MHLKNTRKTTNRILWNEIYMWRFSFMPVSDFYISILASHSNNICSSGKFIFYFSVTHHASDWRAPVPGGTFFMHLRYNAASFCHLFQTDFLPVKCTICIRICAVRRCGAPPARSAYSMNPRLLKHGPSSTARSHSRLDARLKVAPGFAHRCLCRAQQVVRRMSAEYHQIQERPSRFDLLGLERIL